MAPAGRADDLRPDHAVTAVLAEFHGAVVGVVEGGPAGAGAELGVAVEQLGPTAGAVEAPVALRVDEVAGELRLGPLLAEHAVLLLGEDLAPLLVGLGQVTLRFL